MILKECKNCKIKYMARKETSEFCCAKCKKEYYFVDYNCDKCGKLFKAKKYMVERVLDGRRKYLYCDECTQHKDGGKVTNICEVCGNPFMVDASLKNQKYCSQECAAIGNTKIDDKTCQICGKIFHSSHIRSRFCSNACKAKFFENQIVDTCEYCGEIFSKKNSEYINNKHHYCSNACRIMAKIWNQHDVDIMLKYYSNMPIKQIKSMLSKNYSSKAINSEAIRLGLTNKDRNWTLEEQTLLRSIYSELPLHEVEKYFPNKTKQAILHQARNLHILNYTFLKNIYSEEEINYLKENYLSKTNEELALKLNRSSYGIEQKLRLLGLKRPREYNYSCLDDYIRSQIKTWINKVKSDNNWTCCLSGEKSNIVLHHCRSFNLLMEETIESLNFPLYQNINDYTQEELDNFLEYFLFLQDFYGEYCCITEKIHKEFHSIYGYGNNTMEQWIEFSKKYKNIA